MGRMSDLTEKLIRDLLSANRSPGYGIEILGESANPRTIEVRLRFLAGKTYCCAEPGCHLPFVSPKGGPLEHTTILWRCQVEKSARLESLAALGLPLETNGYEYEFITARSDE